MSGFSTWNLESLNGSKFKEECLLQGSETLFNPPGVYIVLFSCHVQTKTKGMRGVQFLHIHSSAGLQCFAHEEALSRICLRTVSKNH